MKNFGQRLFFWIDRLHISPSERYFVSGLMAVYVVLWLADPFIKAGNPYDEEYYAPLMQVFFEHAAERYEEKAELLERYYPGQADTISALAGQQIPALYAHRIGEVIERSHLATAIAERLDDGPGERPITPDTALSRSTATDSVVVRGRSVSESSMAERININTAGLSELMRLPGIGPAMAERIISYRTEHGPFRIIEDIVKVRGIGPARLEQLRDLIEI
jgi:comEA protein